MIRKRSARILASGINNEGSSKAMSAVDAFGPEEAAVFALKMIEKETRGNGDQMNAYERVANRCGVTARQLRRFLSGEIKSPGWGIIRGIQVGWYGLWEDEVRKMQHEMEIFKTRAASDLNRFKDLKARIEALSAEADALGEAIERRKKGITQ